MEYLIKAIEGGDDWRLEVLGAPFGGPENGKDLDGEFFTPNTDFMVKVGDRRPVVYYHGYAPSGKPDGRPEIIGEATVTKVDEKGLWFDVVLDKTKKFAERVWEAAKTGIARASTGVAGHLRRMKENGEITLWAIGELSLLDMTGGRTPSNRYAVAHPIMKATFDEAGIKMPEAFSEAEKAEQSAVEVVESSGDVEPIEEENIKMGDENKEVIAQPIDPGAIAAEVLKSIKAEEDAKRKAEEARQALKAELLAEIEAEAKEEHDEKERKAKSWEGRAGAPAVKKVTSLGFSDDDTKSAIRYLRTGDEAAIKAALQEGSDSEGGYLVPQEWGNRISEKLVEESFVRQLGCQVFNTSRYIVNLPVQGTELTTFVRTAEEGAYDENEGDFESVQITLHKWTKLMKISEELLSDNAFNVDDWLIGRLVAYKAWTENRYVINGTGTSQHQGVLSGGTAGLTFDSTGNITADEIPELLYKLPSQYRKRASTAWVMHNGIEGYLRMIRDANEWAFQPHARVMQGATMDTLYGIPVFNQENMQATLATGTKVMVVGDFSYYALVDGAGDGGLRITRNPYLYEGNGQIGIFARFRQSGAVLQAEAFQYGTMA